MKGLILAAGFASRLRPLTDTTPKCLLQIAGKTILQRMLENLAGHGIRELCVVTGYRAAQIIEFIEKEFPQFALTRIHNDVFQTTNNIYSLYLARPFVLGHDILMLDSDIIFDRRILEVLKNHPGADCLALRSYGSIGDEEMKVATGADGRIVRISKQIPPHEASGESIGIERFSAAFVEKLFDVLTDLIERRALTDKFYELAFQQVIEEGTPLYAADIGPLRCVEIDTAEDLAHAEAEVLKHIDP